MKLPTILAAASMATLLATWAIPYDAMPGWVRIAMLAIGWVLIAFFFVKQDEWDADEQELKTPTTDSND